MTLSIILLFILIIICNVIMDTLRFHYKTTFGLFIKPNSILDKWFNPSISWTNKYISKSKVLTFIFSTILVFITDAWHFFKAILINSAFLIFLILIDTKALFWQWIIMLLVLNFVWFLVYETVNGLLLALPGLITKLRNLFIKGKKQ